MARNTEKLAQRFKAALEAEAARERAEVEERAGEAAREKARAEHIASKRTDLFSDIQTFAAALGFVKSVAKKSKVTLSFRDMNLTFESQDDGASVAFDGSHEADAVRLGDSDEWQLVLHGEGGGAGEWPLFDEGLEELLVVALGLPRPEPEEAPVEPQADAAPAEDEPQPEPEPEPEPAEASEQRPRALPANPAAREAIAAGRDLRTDPLPSPEQRDGDKKKRGRTTAPPGSTIRDFTEFLS